MDFKKEKLFPACFLIFGYATGLHNLVSKLLRNYLDIVYTVVIKNYTLFIFYFINKTVNSVENS